ncbi:MAG: hypothetical protein KKH92_09255 [Firmicutes bacterium]|nr:hypothetical protein [Bacillota bacterium]
MGFDIESNPNNVSNYVDVSILYDNVVADLNNRNITHRFLSSYNDVIFQGEYRVGMRVGDMSGTQTTYDYHFIKQLSNGTWVTKIAASPSKFHCPDGVNPDDIYWYPFVDLYTGDTIDLYDSETIYIAVSP